MLTEIWIQVKLNHPADSKLECWVFLNWSVRALPIYYRITTLSSADKTLPLTVILPKKMNAAIILKRKGSFLCSCQKYQFQDVAFLSKNCTNIILTCQKYVLTLSAKWYLYV